MRVTPNLSTVRRRTSSYSDGQEGGACVEICDGFPAPSPSVTARTWTAPC